MRASITLAAAAALWAAAAVVTAGAQRPAPPAPVEAPRLNPLDLTDADLHAGREAYATHCAGCHGADGAVQRPAGRAAGPSPLDLTGAALRARSDGAIFTVITDGGDGRAHAGVRRRCPRRCAGNWWPGFAACGGGAAPRARHRRRRRLRLGPAARFPAAEGARRQPDDAPAKVELGRHLFYDTRLSADGTFSCGTCHEQRLAFTDGKAPGGRVDAARSTRAAR